MAVCDKMEIIDIAQVAHETNRAYCEQTGDFSQLPWGAAPEWQKASAVNGVKFHIENPDAGCSASHESWLKEKYANGWQYGPVKDAEKKKHPCCVLYEELPIEQKVKDALFVGVVRALKVLI